MREWLKDKRTECGYTMAQMATMLEITEGYYSMIESGERQKKMDMVLAGKLSSVLHITLSEIAQHEKELAMG